VTRSALAPGVAEGAGADGGFRPGRVCAVRREDPSRRAVEPRPRRCEPEPLHGCRASPLQSRDVSERSAGASVAAGGWMTRSAASKYGRCDHSIEKNGTLCSRSADNCVEVTVDERGRRRRAPRQPRKPWPSTLTTPHCCSQTNSPRAAGASMSRSRPHVEHIRGLVGGSPGCSCSSMWMLWPQLRSHSRTRRVANPSVDTTTCS